MRNALRPLFDRVLIKELRPPDMRQSGLLVPDTALEERPPQEGIVIAVGQGLDWWDSVGFEMPIVPGDHVVFPWQAGTYVELEEEKLLVLRVGELLGVMEEQHVGIGVTDECDRGASRDDDSAADSD